MAARFLTAFAAALLLVNPNLWAQSQPADPPGRVGRLSAIEGTVQQRTPDDNDWTAANLNYPVTTGFAIAPQDDGRAEIQVGSVALRVGSASELDVTNLGDRDASLTLAQGELNVRVGRLANGERIAIVTPRGVMGILAAGSYHVDAGTTESPTRFEVFDGRAELQRDAGNTALAAGQAALINADDGQSLTMASAEPDPLDQWAFDRDRGAAAPPANTASAPPPAAPSYAPPPAASSYAPPPAAPSYVSPDMTGAADLSGYGNWNTDPQYGAIWYPRGVPADWAPYTYGHWAWVSPWGWTWIDDEPWGFAPFHYGRWAYTGIGWGWIPGVYVETPVYAPALVVFFGGGGSPFYYGGYHAGIGWCPLGPRELFVPGYGVSVAYVRNVNITNVNINQFNITRVNNTIVVNNDPHWGGQVSNFANHRFATVVPTAQFGQSQRVRDVAVHNASVTTNAASLPVSRAPGVAAPRTAAGAGVSADRGAQFNRGGQPPLPQARTATAERPRQFGAAAGANAPTRTVAGHTLPSLPTAHGGGAAAASSAPSHFGTDVRTPTASRGPAPVQSAPSPRASTLNRAVAGHTLPPLPPAQGAASSPNRGGIRAPQDAVNNPAPIGRAAHGPFGTIKPNAPTNPAAPNVTTSSAAHGLPSLPTSRQPMVKPPAPQPHVAQPPTTTTGSSGHGGFAAPAAPSFQRNAAAPTRNVEPPSRPHVPAQTAAPTHTFTPPSRPQASAQPAAPTHAFTPPQRQQPSPQVVAPTHTFAPPQHQQPSPQVTAPSHTFTPPHPAPNIAAPAHVAPPAAPARPTGNASVSQGSAPQARSSPHAADNNKKRNTNEN